MKMLSLKLMVGKFGQLVGNYPNIHERNILEGKALYSIRSNHYYDKVSF